MVSIGDKVIYPLQILYVVDCGTHCEVHTQNVVSRTTLQLNELHTLLHPYTAFRLVGKYLVAARHIQAEDETSIYVGDLRLCK